ncbi:MAG: RNA methyltransferase [Chitinophagales bacterium]|nr:RNA methyltransferase [Chitinophagales bacterium]
MKKLSISELKRVDIQEYKELPKHPVVVVLDNVRSLHNIGSVFRTCDSFLIHSVYLCGITAQPPHRGIQKTALGATETVNWIYFKNTSDAVASLKDSDYTIIAVEQMNDAIPLQNFVPQKDQKIALIFGHEVKGISDDIVGELDTALEIDQFGTKHSLNISVCAGIVLWHITSSLK